MELQGNPEESVAVQAQAMVEAAEARLRQAAHGGLRRVVCVWHDGVLTLRGPVTS
jgi:hypothetical protein